MSLFFHGGVPDLAPGGMVLPPVSTGRTDTLLDTANAAGMQSPQRRDRVYIATEAEAALLYACSYPFGRGWLYAVEPLGEVEPDPDCSEPGLSFQCERARVVEGRPVTRREARAVLRSLGMPDMPWMKLPSWSRRSK